MMLLAGAISRRALLSCVIVSTPALRTPAVDVPTYSLKGLPGLGSFLGADAPRPELGVIGKGKDGVKSGRLNFCDKKGCISSFSPPDEDSYVPPWTYRPGYNTGVVSSFAARKAQLRGETGPEDSSPQKSLEEALEDLERVVSAYLGATIVKKEPRYLYAEFPDPITGVVDDVEFLFSLDAPIVGYRSQPRAGSDDKRGRARIRDLRKALAPAGWKSVGRIVE
ncbi:hypothetical protein AB1Y20_009816 [Prymnesium parvum]|uniref:Uncharacterized protein n=1 Tax=Prymnesium parvum TaxID=97485 RepID=A0AB34K521_PRYPA